MVELHNKVIQALERSGKEWQMIQEIFQELSSISERHSANSTEQTIEENERSSQSI